MTINQDQIRVLNTIIGHFGDLGCVSSEHVSAHKICVDLRDLMNVFAKTDTSGVMATAVAAQTGLHPATLYEQFVETCCRLLDISRAEVEAIARDTRFDHLGTG